MPPRVQSSTWATILRPAPLRHVPRVGLASYSSHPLGFHGAAGNGGDDRQFRATTILSVRKGGLVAVVGDGQVSRGSEVVKNNAIKVRRLAGGAVSESWVTSADSRA